MTKYMRLERRLPRLRDLKPFLTLKAREVDRVARRLNAAHTISDLRAIAKRRTPAGPFHYVDGGCDAEISMHRTREAFDDLQANPGSLRDVSNVDLSIDLLGQRSALPFGLAPTGGTRMMHAAGERAVGRAAARADIPYALSTVGTTTLSDLAAAVPNSRRWFQLYLLEDRDLCARVLDEARNQGYETLMFTVDVAAPGNRLRDLRTGMTYPPKLTLQSFFDASYRVEWWFNLLTTEPYRFTFQDETFSRGAIVSGYPDPSATFDALRWLKEIWKGPIVVKGIQALDDVRRAADFGADGIVLSNHGGRQLDRTRPPLHLLPDAVAAVGTRTDIMIDSSIRTGHDIVACVALGAKFTWVGRAYLYGLMAGGEAVSIAPLPSCAPRSNGRCNCLASLVPRTLTPAMCNCWRG